MRWSDRRLAVGLFVLSFVVYAWFFSGGGWNQNAHFDLSRALVERGTLYIDGYHTNTGDVSWSSTSGQRHVYINKPPGASLLAAVPYALAFGIETMFGVPTGSWRWITINAYIVTVITCGITAALIPVLLYRLARHRVGAPPLAALLAALAIAFGTIIFPYSTMLFAHVPAAFFFLLAFVWLDERPLLAGVAAGIAGISFLICIPAAAVLFVGAAMRSRRGALLFAAGGMPFGILLGAYQQICFGSPFRTSLEVSTRFTKEGLLFGVFGAPSSEALWGLTFSGYRGLFYASPVLLVAIAGAWVMLRERTMRRELAMIGVVFAIFLVANASFNHWEGGSAFGPRYILPAIPLLGLPLLFARTRLMEIVAIVLAIVSFSIQLIATAVDPMPSGSIASPLRDHFLPTFIFGARPSGTGMEMTSINAQSVDERRPHEKYARGSYEATWASFNLGEFLTGPGRRSSIVPVVLWMIVGSSALVSYARRQH